jgi:hypothetical protein
VKKIHLSSSLLTPSFFPRCRPTLAAALLPTRAHTRSLTAGSQDNGNGKLLLPQLDRLHLAFKRSVKALFASCPVSLSHKSLYSKLIATLDRTTTNIDGTP